MASAGEYVRASDTRRGIIAYQVLTTSDSARAAGVNTDMVLTFTADATRLYKVFFKSQFGVGTASATYALNLSEGGTAGGNDGTAVDRLVRINASESGTTTLSRAAAILYQPASGSKTIRVRSDSGSGGTITLSADGGAAIGSRDFWIEDIGLR